MIIAGIAALLTYAVAGKQSPFGFLHTINPFHHHHAIAKPDQAEDAAQAAEDAAQRVADAAQERADAAQEALDAVQARKDAESEAREEANARKHDLAAENRSVDAFDSIVIEDEAEAVITIGDTQSVSITSSDGDAHRIITSVHDGKLIVSGHGTGTHLRVTVPHLHALVISGAGEVTLEGLRDPISIKTNGSVHLSASGAVDSAELTLNGPSKLALTKLEAKNMTIQLNGVGDAEVFATQTLTADVRGIGRVRYIGDPHTVSTIRGLGSVERLSGTHEG